MSDQVDYLQVTRIANDLQYGSTPPKTLKNEKERREAIRIDELVVMLGQLLTVSMAHRKARNRSMHSGSH